MIDARSHQRLGSGAQVVETDAPERNAFEARLPRPGGISELTPDSDGTGT